MADTINVPGFGSQKKTTVYLVGGLVVIVLGIGVYRARKNAANAVPSGAGIDSDVNPQTGFPYGSAEDAAALNAQADYIQPAQYGYGGGSSTGDTTSYTATGYTSNSQWTQAAEDYLSNTVGHESTGVAAALGHYLAGSPLSPAEVDIVQQAIAAEGYPPQSGPSGYPPSYRTAPASTNPAGSVIKPPSGSKYIRDVATGDVYQVWPDGTEHKLTPQQYAALGKPKYTDYGSKYVIYKDGRTGQLYRVNTTYHTVTKISKMPAGYDWHTRNGRPAYVKGKLVFV